MYNKRKELRNLKMEFVEKKCNNVEQNYLNEKNDIDMKKAYSLVSVCDEANSSWRPTMEDEYRIIPQLPVNGERLISYFGVYDGHGGEIC